MSVQVTQAFASAVWEGFEAASASPASSSAALWATVALIGRKAYCEHMGHEFLRERPSLMAKL